MKTLFAALLASTFAFQVQAQNGTFNTGDSFGPRQPDGLTADTYTGNRASIERADRAAYDRLIAAGGCNAPIVPFQYAIGCGTSLTMQNVFGGADNGQIGSTGD